MTPSELISERLKKIDDAFTLNDAVYIIGETPWLLKSLGVAVEALEYFVARSEKPGHPDGWIRSTKTLGKFQDALRRIQGEL